MAEISKTFATGSIFHPLHENGKVYLQGLTEEEILLPTHDVYETFSLTCAIRLESVNPHASTRGYGIRFAISGHVEEFPF